MLDFAFETNVSTVVEKDIKNFKKIDERWCGGCYSAYLVITDKDKFILVISEDASIILFKKEKDKFIPYETVHKKIEVMGEEEVVVSNVLNLTTPILPRELSNRDVNLFETDELSIAFKINYISRSGRTGSFDLYISNDYKIMPIPIYDLTRGHICHRILIEQKGYFVFITNDEIVIKHIKEIKKEMKTKPVLIIAYSYNTHDLRKIDLIKDAKLAYIPSVRKTFIFTKDENFPINVNYLLLYKRTNKTFIKKCGYWTEESEVNIEFSMKALFEYFLKEVKDSI